VIFVFLVLFAGSFLLYPPEGSGDLRFWHIVLNFIDIGGFEDTNGVGRILILLVNLFGMVLFGGMLVSILTNIIERRIDKVKEGGVFYKFKNHILIIGFDPMCEGLINQFGDKTESGRQKEIVLLTVQNVPEVRRQLFSALSDDIAREITIIGGSRTTFEDIGRLCAVDSSEIFLLGEAGEEDRDSRNIECLRILHAMLAGSGKYIRCHVLFNRQATFTAFQQQDIQEIKETIDFVPFNFCNIWAQKVFVDLEYNKGEITYLPLDHSPISSDSDKKVHLVILGMTNMGVALGVEAAQLCHFPNYISKGIKTRITFIDENADRELDFFKGRFRHLCNEADCFYKDIDGGTGFDNVSVKEKFTDVEFEFIKGRFEQEEIQSYLAGLSLQTDTFLTIAVAIGDSPAAAACGFYLPEQVYNSDTQILIRQELSYATVSMLAEGGGEYRKYKNVKPFGMLKNSYDLERADDLLPMMVKYTYDNTSEDAVIKDFPAETIRQNWTRNWKKTDNVSALKASNRYCADYMYVKQRSLGIKTGEELTNEQIMFASLMEHNRWVMEKLLMGFRAPTKEEAEGIAAGKKREYFKARFIHEDIKAYQALGNDDKNIDVKIYDINISKALPYMLKEYRKIKDGIK
jgi:hypothetical protein